MYKNVKTKIILISVITSLILIGSLSFLYLNSISKIQDSINLDNSTLELAKNVKYILLNARISVVTIIVLFILITILIVAFLARFVICPKNKYIRGDERTELKDKLNEVSSRKNQIETILFHMTDGIIAFNMEGRIELINPAATRLLRLIPEDENFEKIFDKLGVDVNLEKIIYLENWTSSEQRVTIGDNHMHMHFAPLKNEDDIPAGVIVVIQDITEHVRLNNMRKEFVADVSHELKTPITSIMGYADTLLEDEYDKETKDKFLTVIATEARRMAKLVTDLLALSRYDNDEIKQEKVEFDLGELVKRCQDKVQIEIDKKHHKVECFVTANVPPVYADKDGIERVVLNILTNSIKYTKEEGNIKIYVGFVYSDAYIKIIDNGIGIPEEDLTRIFDRFYRVDKARTREMGGTGLGLSIAKEILDKNNRKYRYKKQEG